MLVLELNPINFQAMNQEDIDVCETLFGILETLEDEEDRNNRRGRRDQR